MKIKRDILFQTLQVLLEEGKKKKAPVTNNNVSVNLSVFQRLCLLHMHSQCVCVCVFVRVWGGGGGYSWAQSLVSLFCF